MSPNQFLGYMQVQSRLNDIDCLFVPSGAYYLSAVEENSLKNRLKKARNILDDLSTKKQDFPTIFESYEEIASMKDRLEKDAKIFNKYAPDISRIIRSSEDLITKKAGNALLTEGIPKIYDALDVISTKDKTNQQKLKTINLNIYQNVAQYQFFSPADRQKILHKLASVNYYLDSIENEEFKPDNFNELLFHFDPVLAIKYASEFDNLKKTPEEIGNYLFKKLQEKPTNSQVFADYLYKQGDTAILKNFLKNVNYKGSSIFKALVDTFLVAPPAIAKDDETTLNKVISEIADAYYGQNQAANPANIGAFKTLAKQLFILQRDYNEADMKKDGKDKLEYKRWLPMVKEAWIKEKVSIPLNNYIPDKTLHNYCRKFRATHLGNQIAEN